MLHMIIVNEQGAVILDGPDVDMFQTYATWAENKIGSRPTWPYFLRISKEYYEFEARLKKYNEAASQLRVQDFIEHLLRHGYRKAADMKTVTLFDGSNPTKVYHDSCTSG